eukprot:GGOE01013654.1.p1 GENE.GGOE01013654.1~~GGOE01013654.1.p1  ORF type:complete len:224 (-),score=75.23 GGOE01013654.1:253-891(-)
MPDAIKVLLDKIICAIHHLNEPDGSLPRTIAKCIQAETDSNSWGGLRKALKRGVSRQLLLKSGDFYKVNQTKLTAVAKQKRFEEEAKASLEERLRTGGPSSTHMRKQGVDIHVVEPGKGDVARKGYKVTIRYKGTVKDGNRFDYSKGFSFVLGEGDVIRGWDIGIEGMRQGERRKLTIPPGLAYGKAGKPPDIPPKATLEFDVTLIRVHEKD